VAGAERVAEAQRPVRDRIAGMSARVGGSLTDDGWVVGTMWPDETSCARLFERAQQGVPLRSDLISTQL
jgi:hypothetical protein